MPPETPFDSKDFATLTSDLLQSLATATGAPLTDDNEGSVVRTLAEAFARELAVCYQQLRKVYQHGFLDTAEGVALDHVVALLGMNRQRAGHLEGLVTFRRPQPAPADIPVPSGTLVSGRGAPVCATVEDSLLARGEQEVSVRVRSLEPGGQAVRPGALNLMPRPIWGVGHRRQPRRPATAAKRGKRRRAARAGAPRCCWKRSSARRQRSHRRCAHARHRPGPGPRRPAQTGNH
jgi:hypothetical protein